MLREKFGWRRGVAAVLIAGATALSLVATAPTAEAGSGRHGRCSTTLTTGQQRLDLTVDGVARTAIIYVPSSALHTADRGGAPVLLALHGSNNPPDILLSIAHLAESADRHGDILVVPQGSIEGSSPGTFSWNVPGVTAAPAGTPDDIRFLTALVHRVVKDYCGDRKEVFATGWSGGGRMISAVACETPGLFAAIAPVVGLRAGVPVQDASGTWVPDVSTCSPHRGTPVIAFAGTADPINPYDGGGAAYWQYGAQAALDRWLQIDRCRASRTFVDGVVTKTVGVRCKAPVVSYVIDGAGHTWPGGDEALLTAYAPVLGPYTDAVDANEAMWRFFERVA